MNIWLIRHGESEWNVSGKHAGWTDVSLTPNGMEQAGKIRQFLNGRPFALVLTSTLTRARETCRIAGYGEIAQNEPNAREWSYGEYEGRTVAEIRKDRPDWSVWDDGPRAGETIAEVAKRTQAVIGRALTAGGDTAIFAHGHFLRILAATWLELPPDTARRFAYDPAAISILGLERETRVIRLWNFQPL